jgi:hypothetical protein
VRWRFDQALPQQAYASVFILLPDSFGGVNVGH